MTEPQAMPIIKTSENGKTVPGAYWQAHSQVVSVIQGHGGDGKTIPKDILTEPQAMLIIKTSEDGKTIPRV